MNYVLILSFNFLVVRSKLGLKRCKGSPFLSLVRLPSPTDDAMPPAKEDTVVSSTTSLTTTFLGTTDSAVENDQYCIELIPDPGNPGDAISILKNGHVFDITPAQKDFVETHRTCFDSFDVQNDIIELQNGGIHSVTISVNLINGEVTKQLLFGKHANMNWLFIDTGEWCREQDEKASVVRIQNGIITRSACVDCEWKIEKETRLGNDGDIFFTKDGLPGSWESLEDAKTSCLKTPECTGITNDDGQFLLRTSREKVSDPGKTRTVFKMSF